MAASARPAARYIAPKATAALVSASMTSRGHDGNPARHDAAVGAAAWPATLRGVGMRTIQPAMTAPPMSARRPASRSGAGLGSAA